jgi:putative oxidoreductase
MIIAAIISRYLLGLLFTVFGLNGFLRFIPQPRPPNPVALQFMIAVSVSRLMGMVLLVQLIGVVLFIGGRFVPLAIAVLAPVLLNFLNYHLTMDPGSIGGALVATNFGAILFLCHRSRFAGIFRARPEEDKNNWRLATSTEY